MLAQSENAWLGGATAIVGLIGALLGMLRYFNYRTKRDRIAAVGLAFESVVEALASQSDVRRLAAAIRLRRFFDPESEVGIAGAAYARDALGVTAGILRQQPTGNFQKLLADGLAHAPSLVGADLQRTNLQGAYLGGVDVSRADFYRGDLSHASLKRAVARGAVFYQARLVGTVFRDADLRGANFFQADLTHARFGGAYWPERRSQAAARSQRRSRSISMTAVSSSVRMSPWRYRRPSSEQRCSSVDRPC